MDDNEDLATIVKRRRILAARAAEMRHVREREERMRSVDESSLNVCRLALDTCVFALCISASNHTMLDELNVKRGRYGAHVRVTAV